MPRILIADDDQRLRTPLRRAGQRRAVVLTVGDLEIDVTARTVARAGTPILPTDVADNRIEVHLSALRRKVDAPFGTASIEALRGYGHRIRP